MKIGIIGLAPDLTTLVSKTVSVSIRRFDNAEVVNKWASYLKEELGCDLVIALTHIGFTGGAFIDPVLARDTRNVDIIVGGHSHTLMEDAYYVANLDGVPVPIVQNYCWGLSAGNLRVGPVRDRE